MYSEEALSKRILFIDLNIASNGYFYIKRNASTNEILIFTDIYKNKDNMT